VEHVYDFEEVTEELPLFPYAARRAVDAVGLKVGLAAWQSLPIEARRALVRLGAAAVVDGPAVRAVVARLSPEPSPCPTFTEADAPPPDAARLAALPDGAALLQRWAELPGLARYTVLKLLGGKSRVSLDRAVAELAARHPG
jgi:hypothetical protein